MHLIGRFVHFAPRPASALRSMPIITENNERSFMLDDISLLNREAPAFH